MKKQLFKKIAIFCLLMTSTFYAKAGWLKDAIEPIYDDVKEAFPYITIIVLLVAAGANYGHFFGRDKDYKTGLVNIGMVVVAYTMICGLVSVILSQTIG